MKNIAHFHDVKDAIETGKKLVKLQQQKEAPSREEMIKTLLEAKNHAPFDITALEFMQGDTYFMPWEQFSDADLYRKLGQYQQGLGVYLLRKTGQSFLG